jgi:hypothetical protein
MHTSSRLTSVNREATPMYASDRGGQVGLLDVIDNHLGANTEFSDMSGLFITGLFFIFFTVDLVSTSVLKLSI